MVRGARRCNIEISFFGKTAVITGGSSGIGYAIAKEFLAAGANIAICGTDVKKLENAAQELRSRGGNVLAFQCDVSHETDMRSFAAAIKKKYGGCEIWINNAGIAPRGSITSTDPDTVDRIFAVNVKSIVLSSKMIPTLMPNGGIVLNAGSIAGSFPTSTSGVYGASKAAVATLTRSLAAEFAPLNIRVLCYAPGMIDTGRVPQIPENDELPLKYKQISMRRAGRPDEVAKTVLFMASDSASYMTGVTVAIDGGKFCVQNPDLAWQ